MIKLSSPASDDFHSFKCGEIFCISPAVYNVNCCLCAAKVHLDEFSWHFQMHHLALVEESINLEALECKEIEKLTNDADTESINIKEEDPVDDPIKYEDSTEYSNKVDKSLEQLLKTTEKTEPKLENEKAILSIESKDYDLNIDDKSMVKTIVKKPRIRNSKRSKTKDCTVKEQKDPNEDINSEFKSNDIKEIITGIELDSNKKENRLRDDGDYEVGMDRDWLDEEETSKADSEVGIDNIKDELPYPCHACKRSYRSEHGLQKHNQIVHNPNKKTSKKPKTPKVEHRCDLCNQVFRIARDLHGHRWKHTGIFCDICGKRFTQAGNMMRHKLRHTGIKDYKCEECGKDFFTTKELKSHMICHTGLMPVICEICGKQCRHRGVLTAHMRRHTGERPAKCDVCGKCFFSIHDLNVHAVAHTSERPFKCDICGSTFQRKKALRVHKLIHSKDRKHTCKICGKGFAQSGGLKSHMRTHNAAVENSSIELAEQPLTANLLDNSNAQVGDYFSEMSTNICKPTLNPVVVIPSENTILEQYVN